MNDKELRKKIGNIVGRYGVSLISVMRNIQLTADIELDQNIYYKAQERMEKEIRGLGNINDIFYMDID